MKKVLTFIIISISIQVFSQTIFSNNGKYGLMDNKNEVIIPAKYDKIKNYVRFNDYTGYHLYILQNGNKYSFALKEYWETREYTNMWSDRKMDSVRWHFDQNLYDTLYILASGATDVTLPYYFQKPIYGKKPEDMFQTRSYIALCYGVKNEYGVITFEHTSKQIINIHKARPGEDYDYSKAKYSLTNKTVYPLKYDKPIIDELYKDAPMITCKNNKYGILRLNFNYEIYPQFDSIPILLTDRYYCAKKNNLWGIIYLQDFDSIPIVISSYSYKNLKDLVENYKYLEFATNDRRFPALLYETIENTPLEIKIIKNRFFYDTYLSSLLIGKNKIIDFTPKSKNEKLFHKEDYAYFIATNFPYRIDYPDKVPLFFVIKINKKDKYGNTHESYGLDRYSSNLEWYGRDTLKSVQIYHLENDTFKLVNEFLEEENTRYDIVNYSYNGFGFILKQTLINNNKYKIEFYTLEGEKRHEIISEGTIDVWEQLEHKKNARIEVPIIEFYNVISSDNIGNVSSKRIVCKYDYVKSKFYKR